MIIGFDIEKYINQVLPTFVRKPISTGFAKVLLKPLEGLWTDLSDYYIAVYDTLGVTIETDVLQTKLRGLYPDVGSFKVFIKTQYDNQPQVHIQRDTEHHKREYFYKLSEAGPDRYCWYLSERDLPYDYHVIVPTTYSASEVSIRKLLDRYRPAGKTYLLIFSNITS